LALTKLLNNSGVDSRDAGFVQELSFGAIRKKILHERIIEIASDRKLETIEPDALLALRLGCYQLLEMRVPVHAALNETVNLAKRKASKGAVGFVNAVLRKISSKSAIEWLDIALSQEDDSEQKLSLEYSHPVWIIRAFRQALDSRGMAIALERLLDANNQPARVSLVALPGVISVDDLLEYGTKGEASPYGIEISGNPSSIAAVSLGQARVQDQGSQLAALALCEAEVVGEDKSWLDICAGPGGKAALLAAIARNRGVRLVANEILPHRADLVKQALKQFPEVEIKLQDGRDFGSEDGKYSRILLDAPCTGLGALRRRPEARYRKTADDISELSKLQRELFESSWQALSPGGVLAYVTCSPHLLETTAQVSWALGKFGRDIELLPGNAILNRVNSNLNLDEALNTVQLWPHVHGTDAMFIALFRKSVN
jgi:16S rRNA (cytosine967-C5)-methyltransferase